MKIYFIVYQTLNILDNKIYVGVHKTYNPEVFDGYIGCGVYINNASTYMNPTTPFQSAVKKYGPDKFKRSILKIFETSEEAYNMERDIVNYDFIRRKDTYNAKLGGLGGCSYYVKINQFDSEGNLIKTWESEVEAAEFLGVSHTAIINAKKYKGSCKKYFWSVDNEIDIKEYTLYTGTLCYKYDSITGKCIDTYNSMLEAAKCNDVAIQSIQRAVKGGYKVGNYYYSNSLMEKYLGKPKISLKNKSIYIYDLNGNFITELKNSSEIKEFFNINSTSSLTTAIRTERTYKGFQVSLTKEDFLSPINDKKNHSKKVNVYTEGGDLIETYSSVTKAIEKYGTGVQRVLKGQQQKCKNLIFRYS